MERSEDIREFRRLKREQKIKENAELVNKELLEFEKVLNKYKNDIDDKNPYLTLPILIKTDEVKNLLKENGYIIDKVSNDIEYGTTRIFLDEKEYEANLKLNYLNKKKKESQTEKIKLNPQYDKTSCNNSKRYTIDDVVESIGRSFNDEDKMVERLLKLYDLKEQRGGYR